MIATLSCRLIRLTQRFDLLLPCLVSDRTVQLQTSATVVQVATR